MGVLNAPLEGSEADRLLRRFERNCRIAVIPVVSWGLCISLLMLGDDRYRFSVNYLWCLFFLLGGTLASAYLPISRIYPVRRIGLSGSFLITLMSLPFTPILIRFHELKRFDSAVMIVTALVSVACGPAVYGALKGEKELGELLGRGGPKTVSDPESDFESNPGWDEANRKP